MFLQLSDYCSPQQREEFIQRQLGHIVVLFRLRFSLEHISDCFNNEMATATCDNVLTTHIIIEFTKKINGSLDHDL